MSEILKEFHSSRHGGLNCNNKYISRIVKMKNIKRHVFIMLIYAILVLNFTNASSETEPVLNIKGNGIANQITLKPSDTLSLKVDMEPGSLLGSNADWWIVAKTPSGDWYSWVYPTGWINIGTDLYAISVTYQGALFALSPFEVLSASNLAEGDYDLYFGIDTNMNGVLDYQSLSYSALKVSVSSANSTGGFLLPPASGGNPSFTSEHFSGSANCTMCHNGLNDQNGLDVSIETDWSSTMMANATRDPFWKAKVRSELNRNPQLSTTSTIIVRAAMRPWPTSKPEMRTNLWRTWTTVF